MISATSAFCDGCGGRVVVFVHEGALCGPCFLEHSRGRLQLTYRGPRELPDQQVVQMLARLAAALEAQRTGSPS